MGIKNLGKLINELKITKFLNIQEFSSKTIAIDSSFIVYKFWYVILLRELKNKNVLLEEIEEAQLINKFIYYLVRFIKKLHKFDIEPIFVFDGEPPQEKLEVIDSRRTVREKSKKEFEEIRSKDIKTEETKSQAEKKLLQSLPVPMFNVITSMKILFDALGVQYYVARGEAEKLCSMLVINKVADAVYSSDTDNLALGCSVLITEIRGDMFKTIFLEDLLKKLDLDYDNFKFVCILSGCDYNKNIPRVGFKKIKKLLENHEYNRVTLMEALTKKYGNEAIENLKIEKCLKLFSRSEVNECTEICKNSTKTNFIELEKVARIFNLDIEERV
jgi:flap endonuclease-1